MSMASKSKIGRWFDQLLVVEIHEAIGSHADHHLTQE
jgi:hypothetical protein